jgi:energy-coupling factor transport system permease protein
MSSGQNTTPLGDATTKPTQTWLPRWSTRDLLITAVIGVVFGVLFTAVFYVYSVVLAAVPLAAFAFSGMAYCGPFFLAYVMRNPWAVVLGQLISGLAAVPFHPAGLAVVIGAIIYMVFSLVALVIGTRFKHFSVRSWALAALAAGALNLAWNGFILGSFSFAPAINIVAGALAVASCFGFAFLARSVARATARAGVLTQTPLGVELQLDI